MNAKGHRLSRREFLKRTGVVGAGLAAAAVPRTAAPAVAKKVKLKWIEWITPQISEEKMLALLKAFYATSDGKNIEIERISLPFAQVRDKLVAMKMSKTLPDVLNMNGPWNAELANLGIMAPLDDYLKKEGQAFVDNLVKGPMAQWKGKTFEVPLTTIPIVLFYNEKKLAEAGFSAPPKTWAEVEAMGPKLTNPAKNTYCFSSGMAAQSPYNGVRIEIFPLIYQCNDMVMKDGKPNLTSTAAVKALKFWIKLVNDLKIYAPGVFTNLEADKVEAFGAEQVALVWSNVSFVTTFEMRNAKLKFGMAPLPEGDTYGTCLTGWNASIGADSTEKDAAWAFIRWLCGPEGNAILTMSAKHLPGNVKADVGEMFKADPRLNVPLGILKKGRVFHEEAVLPEVANLCRILVEQVQEAATGKKSPEQALATANTGWSDILKKYS